MKNLIAITKEVEKYTKKTIKSSRFEHSERVAKMCVLLCKQYGLDESKGYLAGIGHDMCKYLEEDEMLETAARDGLPITDYEKTNYKLLHGRAAAVVMKEKFGIEDADILDAVANHVFGRVGLCDIGKVLFVSDKAEPGRPQSTDEYRAELLKLSLNGIMYKVLEDNYNYIKTKGWEIYPETQKMIDYYKHNM